MNYGINGARTFSVLRLLRATSIKADSIVLSIGGNDLYGDSLSRLWDATLIRKFAADPKVSVIRIADLFRSAARISPLDHFHPSAGGYALIAARIAPSL